MRLCTVLCLATALGAVAASYQAVNHTVTATPPVIEPGVSPALTVSCRVRPDHGMPYIGNVVLAFTTGSSHGAPTSAAPATPATTATAATTARPTTPKLHFTFAPAIIPGLPVSTHAPTTTTTTTTTPAPTTTTTTTAPATTSAAPVQRVNLASVINTQAAQLLPSSPFNGTVRGTLDPVQSSWLEITIPFPDTSAAGVYTCIAYGYTDIGKPETAIQEVTVTSQSPGKTDIAAQFAELKKEVQSLRDRWTQVDNSSAFIHALTTADRRYLLSRGDVEGVHMAQFVCTVQGGYLAEINDQTEFDAVRGWVEAQLAWGRGYTDVLLGATDAAQPGTWTLMQNPQAPVFLRWGGAPPSGYHCLALQQAEGFMMNDVQCEARSRFICELPL